MRQRSEPSAWDARLREPSANESSEAHNLNEPPIRGRYRLGRVLAAGGAGVIYDAFDIVETRSVAIKLPNVTSTTSLPAERLRREIAVARILEHPNIVTFLDGGETEDGRPFLVMERLHGHTLKSRLATAGQLSADEAVSVVVPLCGAVAAAHDLGILHRDVTPTNVLLSEEGSRVVPKLLDFGTAHLATEATLTEPGQTTGTPGFMSPEAMFGLARSKASDVWALGALLFTCLSGRIPFPVEAARRGQMPPLAIDEFGDPDAIALLAAIERALEWNAEARFPDARAFAHALLVSAHEARLSIPEDPDPIGLPDWPNWRAGAAACENTTSMGSLVRTTRDATPIDENRHAKLPRLGQVLEGRFRLESFVGTGATGVVFGAVDQDTGERIAIKMLHRSDAGAIYRLKREFRTLSEIDHPNVLRLHELFAGSEDCSAFFTMDLLDGCDLVSYIRSAEDDEERRYRLVACLEQIAQGLHHLHCYGRVHGDIKPSNVLVTRAGHVVIVDFGLTQLLHEAHPDRVQLFVGTPAYAAPEQGDGEAAQPASDWYSLGVVLYESLAGRLPYQSAFPEILTEKRQVDPALPSVVCGRSIAPDLEALCMRLLEREPSRRARSADVLATLGSEEVTSTASRELPFVGRKAERARLMSLFERARLGEQVVVLMSGESGIGKTTLARRFLVDVSERAPSVTVLQSRCFLCESVPYNAIDALVDSLAVWLRQQAAEVVAEVLPADAATLSRLFPVLNRVPSLEVEAPQSDGDSNEPSVRRTAFFVFRKLLQNVARRTGVVLFVDDIQWADTDSANLLNVLFDGADPIPMVFIGTRRSGTQYSSPSVERLFSTTAGAPCAEHIQIGPLEESAIASLTSALEPDGVHDWDWRTIARATGGHPLFAAELIRLSAERPNAARDSLSLDEAIRERTVRLSADARRILHLVCVARRRIPRTFLSAALQITSSAPFRELRLARLVSESVIDETLYIDAYHDRIAEVVVRWLSPGSRRRIYDLIARNAMRRDDAYLDLAIDALVAAGRSTEVSSVAIRAARRAADSLAFHRAVRLLELALEHAHAHEEQQSLRVSLAEAAVNAGRALLAAQTYESAALSSSNEERLEFKRRAMTQYLLSGHKQKGLALLRSLGNELGLKLDATPIGMPEGLFYLVKAGVRGRLRLDAHAQKNDARLARDRLYLRLIWSAAPPLFHTDMEVASRLTMEALTTAARTGEASIYAQALSTCTNGMAGLLGVPLPLMERTTERALEISERAGDGWGAAFIRMTRATRNLLLANHPAALSESFPDAISKNARTELGVAVQAIARSIAASALYEMGRIQELASLSEDWIKDAEEFGDRHAEVGLRTLAAHCHLRMDDTTAAMAELERAENIPLDYNHIARCDPWWKAHIHLYAGDTEEAYRFCIRMRSRFRSLSSHFAGQRLQWYYIVGLSSAAMAQQGIDARGSLRRLLRCGTMARLQGSTASRIIAAQLFGTRAYLRGERRGALRKLLEAARGFDSFSMTLHAASIRFNLALSGDYEEKDDRVNPRKAFEDQGITSPERWARMLAPGLGTMVPSE